MARSRRSTCRGAASSFIASDRVARLITRNLRKLRRGAALLEACQLEEIQPPAATRASLTHPAVHSQGRMHAAREGTP